MKKQLWIVLLSAFAVVAVSALALAAEQGLAKADMKFLMDAADGGLMEVQMGQIAQQKAESPDVKAFGQRMVTDHGKAGDELKALAQQKGVTLPEQTADKHKKEMAKLDKSVGHNFDRMYMEMMVKDHVKDVAEFRRASKKVKDPDLNAWANKTLPTLESHLQQAREVAQKLGMK